MNPKTESASPGSAAKPRFSLLIATCFGIGYLPRAPGTWASLVGAAIYFGIAERGSNLYLHFTYFVVLLLPPVLVLAIALVGVWAAGHVEKHSGRKDPQFVVIDEVSGQLFTYVLGFASPNWKYLFLGFILFRVFDIWKPFPARQAESLPRGWGIMADDWVAAIYAALGLWVARAAGM